MLRKFVMLLAASLVAAPASAWDAHGHRTITYLALEGLPAEAPDWLRDAQVRDRIAFQASEVDRWRGWPSPVLGHVNKPDHYLDIELLEQFGLTLETVPKLRNEYLRAMMISKHVHPEMVDPYEAEKDPDRSKEWPGMGLHAVAETYARLQASFMVYRALERINDPQRAFQLAQARENVIYQMGILSHFVGDLAQPLHTTRHFNGWVGENPAGYTTDRRFHSYIDGGVLRHHRIDYAAVRPLVRYDVKLDRRDPWNDMLAYIRRSHEQVEPLYRMQRDGTLDSEPGRELILSRLSDASATLSALYWAAYTSASPTEKQVADIVFFDNLQAGDLPGRPAEKPAEPVETPKAGEPAGRGE